MYRHDKNGNPTFDRIKSAADLMDQYGVDYNILTVVTQNAAYHATEIYNYYNENALDVQTIEGKSLDLSVLGRTILLGKAVDRVELYNVSGCLISLTENSNHISAPGIGMYIVRIVTEGKEFSQKIWINR